MSISISIDLLSVIYVSVGVIVIGFLLIYIIPKIIVGIISKIKKHEIICMTHCSSRLKQKNISTFIVCIIDEDGKIKFNFGKLSEIFGHIDGIKQYSYESGCDSINMLRDLESKKINFSFFALKELYKND